MSYPEFLDPLETASREFLNGLQDNAIGAICRHAQGYAPLIRQKCAEAGVDARSINSIKDFREVWPFIDKDDIRIFRDTHSDVGGGTSVTIPGLTVSMGTTSGTTGDPTPIPNSRLGAPEIGYARDLWSIGMRPGDYHVHMMFTYRGGHRRRLYNELGVSDIYLSMHPAELPRLVEASIRFRPTVMNNFASPFLHAMEQYIEKTGIDPTDVFSSYKGAIFGGEPLSDRMKAVVKSWGLELYETTSLGDVASTTDCRMHDGFHAYEDLAYIEAIDPITAAPVADGEIGELVVTTLVDRLCPLIRYRTGDLVVIDRSPCGCGRVHSRFKILGRATDQILVDGRSILPREIMGIVENHSETRHGLFQIIRRDREMPELSIRIGYDPERLAGSPDGLKARLHDDIAAQIGVKTVIELVEEAELLKLGPPHKIPRVTKK
jgi:phenylacetate-CoA ligase